MRLDNKVALVTGGASGFGKGIAETFAREGARVAVVDINEQAARTAAASISNKAIALRCDVSRRADVDAAVKATVDAFGAIDVLVNNAGMSHVRRPMLEVEEDEFDRLMAVNVKSIFLFAHAVVPLMRDKKSGVIINIGSTAGIRPRPGLTWYNASKGAVNLLSKSMAAELAPDGIRVRHRASHGGDAALADLHGWRFTGVAGAVQGDRAARPLRHHRRCCQRRAFPCLRGGLVPDRQRAGGGRRALRVARLSQCSVKPPISCINRPPMPLPCPRRLVRYGACGDVNVRAL
jgi:3-oxoacyl-[acyl-carrier protein] reductase